MKLSLEIGGVNKDLWIVGSERTSLISDLRLTRLLEDVARFNPGGNSNFSRSVDSRAA